MKDIEQEKDAKSQSNDIGLSSVVISRQKIQTRRSLLSIILRGGGKLMAAAPKSRLKKNLTHREKKLFESMLARQPDEQKYEIKQHISSGGMGNIFLVHDKDLRRGTILKVILPEHKHSSSIIKDFIKEARITGQLEHPNIIPVHDLGYLHDYGIYFTMKYVQGESLLEIINKVGKKENDYHQKYDFFVLLDIFRKVCDAVSFAHSKKIVHRDIKPGNIMVGNYGEVLLMDWGLAVSERPRKNFRQQEISDNNKTVTKNTREPTKCGIVKGTPAYMAPEQAIADTGGVDRYSDIFLLGATLYHTFTLIPPHRGQTVNDVIENARKGKFKPPEQLTVKTPHLSKELCRIITRAMAFKKQDRYGTVRELAGDLEDLIHGKMEFGTHKLKAGEYLIHEGEPGISTYIIVSGKMQVYKGSGSKKVELGTIGEGDIVGELALIINEPRTASVVALENTEALVLNKDLFTHNLNKLPPWMEKTITALAGRLNNATQKLAALKIKEEH
jgi:eukaryotic-like serine/threonine-protein kinase